CRQLEASAHCEFQHVLNPLCHFTWPTTLWLCCFHFVLIPLTVDHGIFSSNEILEMDLLHRSQPITVPCLNLLSS
ncbi:unnamed protein product, partial [Staurois parvus]